jgi:hypothetical protein
MTPGAPWSHYTKSNESGVAYEKEKEKEKERNRTEKRREDKRREAKKIDKPGPEHHR